MLNREQKSVVPADDRIKDLDDKLIDYLYDKISNIRKDLEKEPTATPQTPSQEYQWKGLFIA